MKFFLIVIYSSEEWSDAQLRVTRSKANAIDYVRGSNNWDIREVNINEIWSEIRELPLTDWCTENNGFGGDHSFDPEENSSSITSP